MVGGRGRGGGGMSGGEGGWPLVAITAHAAWKITRRGTSEQERGVGVDTEQT